MLKKLMKYDMKALTPIMLAMHLPFVPMILATRYFAVPELIANGPKLPVIALLAAFLFYLSTVSVIADIYFASYTYKSLFTSQGYLTLTLPASPMQHLMSKFLSGSIWFVLGRVCLWAIIPIIYYSQPIQALLTTPDGIEFVRSMQTSLRVGSIDTYLNIMWVLIISGAFTDTLFIIGSICFGQLFQNHRIIWGVLVYFCTSLIIQLVCFAVSFKPALSTITDSDGTLAYTNALLRQAEITTLLVLVIGVGYFILSLYVLRKRVNLT